MSSQPQEVQERMRAAAQLGVKVRDLQAHGQEVPPALLEPFEQAEQELFGNVRAIFGGNLRQAVSGAAPIAKEILEFFYGCGVPVLEGYGMTETATVASYSTIENHRFGVGRRALPGVEAASPTTASCLLKGRPTSSAVYYRTTTRASARSSTAGCTPATWRLHR
jgi:long-chain acyl-CoA synthetase